MNALSFRITQLRILVRVQRDCFACPQSPLNHYSLSVISTIPPLTLAISVSAGSFVFFFFFPFSLFSAVGIERSTAFGCEMNFDKS